ncbi:MAG: endonuclease, partial [Clostridiaceae bacterium]|nr:endonuclease [Clostridiaceae bacterium]
MKNLLEEIYLLLSSHYGDLRWWPADTPFEVMVGAILTQNTAWTNVEKAIKRFEGNLSPERIL